MLLSCPNELAVLRRGGWLFYKPAEEAFLAPWRFVSSLCVCRNGLYRRFLFFVFLYLSNLHPSARARLFSLFLTCFSQCVSQQYRVPRSFKLLAELEAAEKGKYPDSVAQYAPYISLGLKNPSDMTLTTWNASIIPDQVTHNACRQHISASVCCLIGGNNDGCSSPALLTNRTLASATAFTLSKCLPAEIIPNSPLRSNLKTLSLSPAS